MTEGYADRPPTDDPDVLNGRLYEAVRDGYIEKGGSAWYHLTPKGVVRARVIAMAIGLDPDNLDPEGGDPTAVALSLVSFGFVYVK